MVSCLAPQIHVPACAPASHVDLNDFVPFVSCANAESLCGVGGGSFDVLESYKREEKSDVEKWKASMPWMALDELKLSFGYCQQVPSSEMSLRAETRAIAVKKYCEKLGTVQAGREVHAFPCSRVSMSVIGYFKQN